MLWTLAAAIYNKWTGPTTSELPFPEPTSDSQCAANIRYILRELSRFPDTVAYSAMPKFPAVPDELTVRGEVVQSLSAMIYMLRLCLLQLSGNYAAFPLFEPVIRKIMPAVRSSVFAIGNVPLVLPYGLDMDLARIRRELAAALVDCVGKDAIVPHYYKAYKWSLARVERDRRRQEQKLQGAAVS